ncbi:MAG TPA: hypothetical protein DIW46_04515 [Microbacterium sp.]|uniref:alpha/beta fold hydrolase n=1 Tax=Microbacterium sp. TaxID=51671 RepID=UPI000EE64A25|nr:hypothetical protein [Microbacterium sp.]
MLLNSIEAGSGDHAVLLLHGMMGSAESWWKIAALLAERGCRVIALDLPGHGDSPRDSRCTVASAADAVIETVQTLAPSPRVTAIGHSYGGTVLAAAANRLPLELAVYVDTTCAFSGGADRAVLTAQYAADRERRRDAEWLRATRPHYSAQDALVEARAADRFDPATAASISAGADVSHLPAPGSILVRADPSSFVTAEEAHRLSGRGVDVRSIPNAAHTVWYSHFDDFTESLPELFGDV